MIRISRHSMFMEIAGVVAKRSTCLRLNVGAVIVSSTNRIVSIGYNGQLPGHPHCLAPCEAGMCNTIHAEKNALNYAPSGEEWLSLYVTDSPCDYCARTIASDGRVKRVFFQTPYRIASGYNILLRHGIDVTRILPSGILIDMEDGRVISA